MDSTLGGSAGRFGGGGRTDSGGGSGSRNSTYTLGGGGASTAAWTRLVSSGVEDELFGVAGAGGGRAGVLFPPQPPPQGHFLDACFLCRRPLASNRDIFMYRGDIPFCSEDCRREQIEMDEEIERKETTGKKVAQRASPQGVESPPRPPKARAGSILAG